MVAGLLRSGSKWTVESNGTRSRDEVKSCDKGNVTRSGDSARDKSHATGHVTQVM